MAETSRGIELHGTVGGLDGAREVPAAATEASHLEPGLVVVRRRSDRLVELGRGGLAVVEGDEGLPPDAGGVACKGRSGRAGFLERALRFALEEERVRHQVPALVGGDPRLARPSDLRGCGDAVAESQVGAGLHHAGAPVIGVGLDGVQELDARRAGLARLEGRDAALIGTFHRVRARRIRTGGGRQEKSGEREAMPDHG